MANYNKKNIEWYENECGCFVCTSHSKSKNKRPKIKRNGKTITVYRYIYQECFGEVPKGMVIMHTCDNPSCINPEHLRLGTQKDNMQDMISKGRKYKKKKVSEEDIVEIRKSTLSSRKLAKIYGVDKSTILNYKK